MIIYKSTKTGAIQQWSQEIEGSKYRTISGQVGGKLVISDWTQCGGTNTGRTNERTPEQQAIFEVESNYKKKLDKDYHTSLEAIEQGSHIFEPMLAYEYKKRKDRIEDYSTLYSQPKLNGMRCIVKNDGMWSRNGKKIVSAPHIFEAFKETFEKYPNLVFDGELYNHDLKDDFNELMSIFKKTKPTEDDLYYSRAVGEYHVYDISGCGDQTKFQYRLERIKRFIPFINSLYIIMVRTDKVKDENHLDDLYKEYLFNGYEGQMVRQDDWYNNKRSWALMKRKEFKDAEFELLDISEGLGNWQGKAKTALLKLSDGRQFSAGITGTMEYCANILNNKQNYIGKKTTVNFFQYTPDGIPLFPRVKELDRIDV